MITGLLSRIAETLFWTGRYIERADDTARMVDVYVHRMLEEPHADQEADCRALLAVLGIPAADSARLDIGHDAGPVGLRPGQPERDRRARCWPPGAAPAASAR